MVAGEGQRIRSLTDAPKCFLEINGCTILENAINCLTKEGITNVVLITGYKAECFRNVISKLNADVNVALVHNPLYKETNNMYSLFLARDFLKDGALVFDGDIFFEQEILHKVIADERTDCWAGDLYRTLEGSVLTKNDSGKIINIEIVRQKALESSANRFKSAAIIRISSALGKKFSNWLEQEVNRKNTNVYIDLVLAKNLDQHDIFVADISGLKWFEIDTEDDYELAKKIFK